MKALLEGKPFKHPLHPMLVHLPIGLLAISFLFDIASFFADPSIFTRSADYCLLFGVVMALVAAVPGFVDYSDIRRDHPGKSTATTHMMLNLIAVVVFAISLMLRRHNDPRIHTPMIPLVFSLVGVGIISFSGYLGGILVYDEGIAVGRHRRRSRTPGDTYHISGDGFVPVAPDSALADNSTLRVELNGHVVAIARLNGQLYAFQEFCTHRYGPLSEGCLQISNNAPTVECPWHRSCFDISNGKVLHGPAKVELRTYAVRQREGQIELQAQS